jgi:acetyl esterase/lipase
MKFSRWPAALSVLVLVLSNGQATGQAKGSVALTESTGKLPPIFVARAGKDQIPDLLPGLDRFVAEALARNAPLVLYNQPDGEHGFDNQEGDPRSREIVREAVEFLKRNLVR